MFLNIFLSFIVIYFLFIELINILYKETSLFIKKEVKYNYDTYFKEKNSNFITDEDLDKKIEELENKLNIFQSTINDQTATITQLEHEIEIIKNELNN